MRDIGTILSLGVLDNHDVERTTPAKEKRKTQQERHLTTGLDKVRTSRLPQKEEPQLNRETEPGNFGFSDDLLFMISSRATSKAETTRSDIKNSRPTTTQGKSSFYSCNKKPRAKQAIDPTRLRRPPHRTANPKDTGQNG
ncbi:hypothetical protein YC2023_085937 [Brassica napus]